MRVVLTAAITIAASSLGFGALAHASSIENIVTARGATPSVLTVTCATCPPLSDNTDNLTQSVPKLAEGTQKIEIRTVDGQKQLVRTEAWFGGSPVVVINKQAGWLDNGSRLAGMPSDGVDKSTETGAVHQNRFANETIPLRLE